LYVAYLYEQEDERRVEKEKRRRGKAEGARETARNREEAIRVFGISKKARRE
jgi:hypothetical protein